MNSVVCYSNTGQSRAVAEFLANKLNFTYKDIEAVTSEKYENLVLVFPVHCQNIPDMVKKFLEKISVEKLTIIATYGKMCPGNVLYEIQHKYHKNIVAAAYVPTKHSYIEDDVVFNDFEKLQPIIDKIQTPSLIELPRKYKNPFANFFPKLRSIVGLKIIKTAKCNNCNKCGKNCSLGAIENGVTNRNCIRCLKCVEACPYKALRIKKTLGLKIYLSKKKMDEIMLFI